jgi:hypothetical protein
MSATDAGFPAPFADLARYADWSLPTENARRRRRIAARFEEIQALYDAVVGRLEGIAAYLDPYPVDAIPPHARGLYLLMLAFADVAPYVEYYGAAQVPDSFDELRFAAEHGDVPA